jgi:hypothetical protein
VARWCWRLAFGIAIGGLALSVVALVLSAPILVARWSRSVQGWVPLCAGAVAYLATWRIFLRRRGAYLLLSTLDHELLHTLVAMLTGGRVTTLSVTAAGQGTVTVAQPNPLVALAPYTLSFPLLATLALGLALPDVGRAPVAAALGVTTSYHLVRVATSCVPEQPDFRHSTFPLGLVWALGCNALLLGLIASVAGEGADGARDYVATLVQQLAGLPTRMGWTGS